MAEHTETNSAKSPSCQQFLPAWPLPSPVGFGRVECKLCHHKQPQEERPTTSATAGRFVCSITRGQTVLEELLEKDAVVELDNYRD